MSQELRVDITGNSKGLQRATKDANKNLNNFNKGLNNIGKSIAGIFAAREIINFGKAVLTTTANFQRMGAVLENTLGSKSAASVAMLRIQEFASKTPFQVDELTDSFVKLANQGFKPTISEMTKLGDLASSQGKSFNQLTEAIIDAQVGEFERLKEFGIRASKEGDRVKFTFKGVKKEVDFTSDSIREYILSLGDAQGVSGGMDKISKTLGGRVSNLNDAFTQLQVTLGNLSSNEATGLIAGFSELVNNINLVLKGVTNLRLETYKLALAETGQKAVTQYQGYIGALKKAQGETFNLSDAQDSYIKQLESTRDSFKDSWREGNSAATKNLELINEEIDAVKRFIELNPSGETDKSTQATKEFTKIMEAFNKRMAIFNTEWSLFGENDIDGKINAVKAAMTALTIEGTKPALEEVKRLRQELERLEDRAKAIESARTQATVQKTPLTTPLTATPDGAIMTPAVPGQIQQATSSLSRFQEMSQLVGFTWENLGVQFSQVFTGMLENGTLTFKGLMIALIKMITQLTVALITATALRSMMGDASATPRAMQAAAAVASGIGGLAAASIPAMAEGGVVSSPTLALIGEGRESEAVIPLSKLDAMMSNSGGGGVGQVVLRGQDLILAYDRAKGFNTRISG